MKSLLPIISLLALCSCRSEPAPNPPTASKWISAVVEYRPAPGQFINTTTGNPDAAASIVAGTGAVSLGGWGGYIIIEFDHDVENRTGVDFVIHGNSFNTSSEPGIVCVSPDGKEWYELKGSEPSTENYTITYFKPETATSPIRWVDNHDGSGEITSNSFHRQSYYPTFLAGDPSSITFSGRLLSSNLRLEQNIYIRDPYPHGYADNFSDDYLGEVGGDPDTRGSNKFDIDNAIDATGRTVTLTRIKQIKIYSALNDIAPAIGESSPEICGAISLSAPR